MTNIAHLAKKIRLVIFDVDGVMTDGSIIYSSDGSEIKHFNVQDGLGIKLLHKSAIQTAIITGRNSTLVEKRAAELGIHHLVQGRDDKLRASLELINTLKLKRSEVAYMGDDLPDLGAIKHLGLGITVSNANEMVKQHADYICHNRGGNAAVREACEFILSAQEKLEDLTAEYLHDFTEQT